MIRQKGGGRSGVQRTPRFGAREQKIRSDEDTALSKLSPKDPKEIAKKFREWMRKSQRDGGSSTSTSHKLKGKSTKDFIVLSIYHTEKRSRRATPEIFLFCLSLAGGSFTHVVRVHVELLTP